jgi:cytochrome c oxidase subunit 2
MEVVALEPSFGGPQVIIAVLFAVLAAGIAGVFALVAAQTRRDLRFELVQRSGYRIRRLWLAFLVVLMIAVVGGALFALPYSSGAGGRKVVRVTGGQFYWSISPQSVRAGTPVRFDVTAADVNHGFGVYSPGGELIGSVQAMPGFHNELDLTLDEPGSYFIGCLEFCGVGHHRMSRRLKVTEE